MAQIYIDTCSATFLCIHQSFTLLNTYCVWCSLRYKIKLSKAHALEKSLPYSIDSDPNPNPLQPRCTQSLAIPSIAPNSIGHQFNTNPHFLHPALPCPAGDPRCCATSALHRDLAAGLPECPTGALSRRLSQLRGAGSARPPEGALSGEWGSKDGREDVD